MNTMNNPSDTSTAENPAEGAEIPSMAEELAQAVKERDEFLDQLQRSRAEFANYQKRSKAQADQNQAYAVGGLAQDIVAVLDNFDRALEAAKTEAAKTPGALVIVDGLSMVHKQLLSALAKHGVEPIEAMGHPFDPNQHEALTQMASTSHPHGTVVAELGKGYRLKDRILRPAKVAVSIKPE